MKEQDGRRRRQSKQEFNYCTYPSGQEILYLRALQGHSGRNPNDPSLQDNVLIPNNFFEYIYHIGCAVNLHPITNSGLIAGGHNSSRGTQTVLFTSVNPMHKNDQGPNNIDLEAPRLASYKQKWKVHQDTVYWVDVQLTVIRWREETLERTKFDRDTLNQEKHDKVTDPTSTVRPVSGHEFTKRCVLTPRHVENDQTGSGKPVTVDQKEEHKIDFSVSGLSHSVVKEAEHLRVQELVKRIDTHPHRAALHADLKQNNVYYPFCKKFQRDDSRIG